MFNFKQGFMEPGEDSAGAVEEQDLPASVFMLRIGNGNPGTDVVYMMDRLSRPLEILPLMEAALFMRLCEKIVIKFIIFIAEIIAWNEHGIPLFHKNGLCQIGSGGDR